MIMIEKTEDEKLFILDTEENLRKCEIKNICYDFYKVVHFLKGEDHGCENCTFNYIMSTHLSQEICKECEYKTYFELLDVYDYEKHQWKDTIKIINSKDKIEIQDKKYDNVKKPKHYMLQIGDAHVEVLDIIKATLTPEEFRGFLKGNIIKYILRERNKNGIEDIKKCKQYCEFMEKENG